MAHLHFRIYQKSGSTQAAFLSAPSGTIAQAEVSFPESLHQNTSQLLESKRGSEKNTTHPGLPVDKAKLEQQIIKQLHETLLSGSIGQALKAQQASLAGDENLQLVIQAEGSAIRNLPWETVAEFSESVGVVNLNIVRTLQPSFTAFQAQQIPAPTAAPLKLLFVTALPENISERGKELQIEDEQRKLIEAVGNLEATGDRRPKMVIEFLDVASLEEMTAALKARRHDILHISGHGGFNEKINQAVLHLENEDGDHLPTEATDFANALRGHDSLRLVVLSACETAVVGPGGGMVEAVAAIGVPAVLGMRFTVGDAEAKLFTTHFYQHLANGAPITQALAVARQQLWELHQQKIQAFHHSAHSGNSANSAPLGEWFTPVLYLNGAVGALVDAELSYREIDDFYTRPADGKRRIGSGFIGRKRQLIQMRRAFRAGRHVCLVGMGGMGKTTLAEAFAANYENGAYDPIILRGGTEIHEFGILNQIVLAYGRRHQGKDLKSLRNVIENGDMPILNRLHFVIGQCLKDEKVFLVFDNFEDLQDQSGWENSRGIISAELRLFLEYLMAHCPSGCHLLFTTRYRIEGLPDAVEMLNLDKLSPAEQYRWLSYSRELRYVPAADRLAIYRRLDGLPRAFQFLEALARNKKDFDWGNLESELGKVEARVFENLMLGRIYGLLSPELQRVFLVASVFFTRTPIAALVAVLEGEFEEEALRGCLGRLLDWGLCFWDVGDFEMHGLTRQWVGHEGLFLEQERKQVALGVGEYFLSTRTFWNVRLAMEYFRISENWDQFTSAAMNLYQNLERVGLYDEALEVCKEILANTTSEENKCAAYSNIGKVFIHVGRFDEALHFFESGLEISVRIGQESTELAIRNGLSKLLEFRNNHNLALDQLNICLSISRKLERREEEQITLNNIGNIYLEMKDKEKAKPILEQSLRIAEELRDGLAIAGVLVHLGYWEKQYGDASRAIQLYQRSLQMHRENEHRQGEASILNNLGRFYMDGGELAMAIRHFRDALEIMEDIGNLESKSKVLFNLACAYERMDEFQLAWETIEECQKVSVVIQDYSHQAMNLLKMGELLCSTGQLEDAIPHLIDSKLMYSRLGMPDRERADAYLNAIIDEIGIARYNEICSNLNPKVR